MMGHRCYDPAMGTRRSRIVLALALVPACVFDTSGLAPPSPREARATDAPSSEHARVVDLPAAPDRAGADAPLDVRADSLDQKLAADRSPDQTLAVDKKAAPDRSPDKKAAPDKSPDKKLAPDWWPSCSSCGCGKQCSGSVCVCKHFFCDDPPTAKQAADCAQIAAAEGSFHICKLGCCTGECGP